MTSAQIRQSFLDYFEARNHRVVPSSPLVPADDPTLLFTNAGMNQFKDVFLGAEQRDYRRATTSQKCMRVSGKHNDLENVGPSLRHHTFFEMLGNFSFGDYFKADAIPFAWELLTEVWKLPADRLHVTVFKGEDGVPRDDEAYDIWRALVPADRIAMLGAAENFWAMGDTGPCGRCSEVHYHRGDDLPCPTTPCVGIDCPCDRYVEIWNNVFMEFQRHEDGSLTPLPAPSIDTGMGLERIVAVLQDKLSNYDTDLFTPLLTAIGQRAGVPYGPLAGGPSNGTSDVSLRVIADHLRAMTFLIADGVIPSNEWRGYVLRKIMRRAMRHGKKLGIGEPFLHELCGVVITEMGHAYPELEANRDTIASSVRREEEQFDKVLTDGLPRLEAALDGAAVEGGTLGGNEAFRLYDTFGLPLDFIEDLAGQRAIAVDHAGFDRALEVQRTRARAGSQFAADDAPAFTLDDAGCDPAALDDRFIGYETTSDACRVAGLFGADGKAVERIEAGNRGYAILDRTPFYLEAGGQVSDTGKLSPAGGADLPGDATDGSSAPGALEASVVDVIRPVAAWPRMHVVEVRAGILRDGDTVTASVDAVRRDAIRRNHTATHLLHATLRTVVGEHVRQAGSLVAPDRLRFDITHHEPVTHAQVREIERIVNTRVFSNQPVETEVRDTQTAIADGAMALFGEKYGDRVRVVQVPGFSTELCGGTHCRATGDIGPFVITQEGGVAAGVRRLEAMTGAGAIDFLQQRRETLDGLLGVLGAAPDQAVGAVRKLQTDTKRLARDIERLKVRAALAGGAAGDGAGAHDGSDTGAGLGAGAGADDGSDVRVVTRVVSGLGPGALRLMADQLRERIGSGVVVLASDNDGKAALTVAITRDLTDRVHAGKLINALAPIVGGRGGGRPDFAQAGGKQTARLAELPTETHKAVEKLLADS
ncbi:MAG: alanine--tRNA ligase [Acidobacteria bacterium]|nr:alanine--tRNA ligase [Acidobacteriota bacterium]